MNSISPLVSICIPSFNGEHLISRALESCINQTYKNIEVVVVDDASTDNTIEIVKDYAKRDSRIKFFQNKTNIGLADNFLKTYKAASGEFIQHLNQDDWLDNNYIEGKITIFNKYPDVAFVSSADTSYELNSAGNPILIRGIVHKPGFYSADYVFKNFYKKNGLINLFCMARKSDMINNFMTIIPNKYGYGSFYKKGVVIDSLVFLNILSHYKNMYYTDRTFYNGLSHPLNASKFFGLKKDSISDSIKFSHITRVGFEYFYASKAKKYLFGYRVFTGADMMTTVFFDIIFRRAKNFSFKALADFFHQDYSAVEKMVIVLRLPFYMLKRGFKRVIRHIKE